MKRPDGLIVLVCALAALGLVAPLLLFLSVPMGLPVGLTLAGMTVLIVALAALQWHQYRRPAWLPAVRHAAELWVSANPHYTLDDARVPAELREALTLLAAQLAVQRDSQEAVVAGATAAYGQDRSLLRALIESMDGARIAATIDGRVLLYNAAAARLLEDEESLALGRSIFVIFRRWSLSHFVARMVDSGRRVSGVLASRRGQNFHARFTALDLDGRPGFLLALQPLADYLPEQSDLARLVQPRRARLASLQAALESLNDFPDLTIAERQPLLTVAIDETAELVRSLAPLSERLQAEATAPLDDVATHDLRPLLAGRLGLGDVSPDDDALWLRAESASLASMMQSFRAWLTQAGATPSELHFAEHDDHALIRVIWAGGTVDPEALRVWETQPLAGSETSPGEAHSGEPSTTTLTPQQLLEWQHGSLWSEVYPGEAGGGALNLLLLRATEPAAEAVVADVPARPEYFDFALFDAPTEGRDLDQPLDRLSLTAFDTETTGLNPREGDEIISMGAIRVLNGRLIGQEVFETLVGSTRAIHPESQKIHGIDARMLQGAPAPADALRRFLGFAGDSLLLGHNVAFDMRFLEIATRRYGLTMPGLTLDTLLLSSVVYPESKAHRLEDVAQRLGVTVLGRHTSLGDALLAAEVYCHLLPLLAHRGIHTLGQALEASRASWYARLHY